MNNKEKLILSKLVKIAANQQKILERLAQEQDPNINYLRTAAQVTAVNTNFTATSVDVKANPGSTVGSSQSPIKIEGGYTVTVGGAPPQNEVREKFIRQLKAMVASQKPNQPELANLSVVFAG